MKKLTMKIRFWFYIEKVLQKTLYYYWILYLMDLLSHLISLEIIWYQNNKIWGREKKKRYLKKYQERERYCCYLIQSSVINHRNIQCGTKIYILDTEAILLLVYILPDMNHKDNHQWKFEVLNEIVLP